MGSVYALMDRRPCVHAAGAKVWNWDHQVEAGAVSQSGSVMALVKYAVESDSQRKSAQLNFGTLSRLLGFNVRLAQVAFHRDFMVAMKGLELTQKQYAVLTIVGANPGVSQIDIATALGADRATMMAIVDRLQNRAFLERVPSKADRRRQELYLTQAGEAARAEAEVACIEHEGPFRERFTAEELHTLFELLKRLQVPPQSE